MSFLSELRNQLFIMAGVKTCLEDELVPALIGNGIEKRSTFNGFCYSLLSRENDLSDRLFQIRDLFNQAMDRLQNACLIHHENLQKENGGKPFDNNQREKAERRILQICTYLNPFIKQFIKDLDLPYIKFLSVNRDKKFFFYFFVM